jgi:hypothetical protein
LLILAGDRRRAVLHEHEVGERDEVVEERQRKSMSKSWWLEASAWEAAERRRESLRCRDGRRRRREDDERRNDIPEKRRFDLDGKNDVRAVTGAPGGQRTSIQYQGGRGLRAA